MKRFTETTRFEDPWYRKLSPAMKLAWEYLYAKCDNAGVIDLDREGAEFHIGATVDWNEFLIVCGPKRIAVMDNGKWWLLKFVEFQYGKLSDKSAPHRKVLSLLEQHGLMEGSGSLHVGYKKATSRLKEEDKDKEKEEAKDKAKEARAKSSEYSQSFLRFWDAFPKGRKKSKGAAWKAWNSAVSSLFYNKNLVSKDAAQEILINAAREYAMSDEGRGEYVKMPSTWLNGRCWEDDREAWTERPHSTNGQQTDAERARANREAEKARMRALEARNAT